MPEDGVAPFYVFLAVHVSIQNLIYFNAQICIYVNFQY